MKLLTVTNRTSSILKTTWNGIHYDLAPHETQMFPELVATAFKRWNPQMGSLNPQTGQISYLVAIKEQNDPATPIEQTNSVEVWDRSKLTGSRPSEVVPGDNGLYSEQMWKRGQSLDLNFDGR